MASGSGSRVDASKPSASGVATAAARSTSSTPVADSAVSSWPLRTACAQPSSIIAAVSVASIWSATAEVTLVPRSPASRRAWVVTAAVSCRRCLVSARSSSPDIPACASRSATPDGQHLVDLLGLVPHQRR